MTPRDYSQMVSVSLPPARARLLVDVLERVRRGADDHHRHHPSRDGDWWRRELGEVISDLDHALGDRRVAPEQDGAT